MFRIHSMQAEKLVIFNGKQAKIITNLMCDDQISSNLQ